MTASVVQQVSAAGAYASSQTVTITASPEPGDVVVVVTQKVDTTSVTGLGATWVKVQGGTHSVWIGTGATSSGAITASGVQNYRTTRAYLVRGLSSADYAITTDGTPLDADDGCFVLAAVFTGGFPTATLTPSAGWSGQVDEYVPVGFYASFRYRLPAEVAPTPHDVSWSLAGATFLLRVGTPPAPIPETTSTLPVSVGLSGDAEVVEAPTGVVEALSGKVLWLRAKDLGAHDSQVPLWPDQSGMGHDATGTGAGTAVKDATTPAGGKSVFFSDGTLDLPNSLGLAPSSDAEMWLVVKSSNTNGTSWKYGTNGAVNHFGYAGKVYEDFGSTTRQSFTPTVSIGNWVLYRVRVEGSTWSAHLNGAQQQSTTITKAWNASMKLANLFDGNIAEALILNRPVTAVEEADLITYFNIEHGLTVPGGSAAPIPETTGSLPVSFDIGAGAEVVHVASGSLPVDADLSGVATEPDKTSGQLPVSATLTGVAAQVLTAAGSIGIEVSLTGVAALPPATDGTLSVEVGMSALVVPVLTSSGELAIDVALTGVARQPGQIDGELPVMVDLTGRAWQVLETTALLGAIDVDFAGAAEVPAAGVLPITVGLSAFVAREGSLWWPYDVAESGSRLVDFSVVPTSPESVDPYVWEGDIYANSLWLALTSSDSQILTATLTAAFEGGIELFSGDVGEGPDEIALLSYGLNTGPVEAATIGGQRVLIRVHPTSDLETGTATVEWSVAYRPPEGTLAFWCAESILETPGWLRVDVTSAWANAPLEFTLDGSPTVVDAATADADGQYVLGSILLPELAAGAHTITVTDTLSGQTASSSFTVDLDVESPAVPLPGTAPTTPYVPDTVIKWVFEDPVPGGEVYTLPINPSAMSQPFLARAITAEHTLHGSGHQVLWEGTPEPVAWKVEGTITTQAHYEAFERFFALRRRFYVIDHLQRAWVVAFKSFEPTEMRSPDNEWAYTYKAQFLILEGPVSLS